MSENAEFSQHSEQAEDRTVRLRSYVLDPLQVTRSGATELNPCGKICEKSTEKSAAIDAYFSACILFCKPAVENPLWIYNM